MGSMLPYIYIYVAYMDPMGFSMLITFPRADLRVCKKPRHTK